MNKIEYFCFRIRLTENESETVKLDMLSKFYLDQQSRKDGNNPTVITRNWLSSICDLFGKLLITFKGYGNNFDDVEGGPFWALDPKRSFESFYPQWSVGN